MAESLHVNDHGMPLQLMKASSKGVTMNLHPLAHYEGWMVSGPLLSPKNVRFEIRDPDLVLELDICNI
jgi:hypothetical protein